MSECISITIAVPNYNNIATITETLKSLENQTCKNFRIVISDNHSSDSSKSIIENWCRDKKNCSLISPDKHLTYVEHLMFMVKSVNSKYVVFLAGDDILSDNFVKLSNKIVANADELNAIFYRSENFIDSEKKTVRKRFTERCSKKIRYRSLNSPLGNISGNVYNSNFVKTLFNDKNEIRTCGNCIDHYLCVKATEGRYLTSNYIGIKYRVHQGSWGGNKRRLMSQHHIKFLREYLKHELNLVEKIILNRRLLISYLHSIF